MAQFPTLDESPEAVSNNLLGQVRRPLIVAGELVKVTTDLDNPFLIVQQIPDSHYQGIGLPRKKASSGLTRVTG